MASNTRRATGRGREGDTGDTESHTEGVGPQSRPGSEPTVSRAREGGPSRTTLPPSRGDEPGHDMAERDAEFAAAEGMNKKTIQDQRKNNLKSGFRTLDRG